MSSSTPTNTAVSLPPHFPDLPPPLSRHIEPDPLLANDPVLMLRESRRRKHLTQKMVAALCGVGEKTISSFETGERIERMKVSQLRKLLRVYGLTLAQFFTGDINAIDTAPPPHRRAEHCGPLFYAQFISCVLLDAERDGVSLGEVIDAVRSLRAKKEGHR